MSDESDEQHSAVIALGDATKEKPKYPAKTDETNESSVSTDSTQSQANTEPVSCTGILLQ
jgi:hypothetical protein